jgi:PAS domain S-box-containing protein
MWENGRAVSTDEFAVLKCLATGEDQEPVTMGVRRPNGGISWAVFTAVPLMDIASGKINGAVLTFLNITGRKQTEDALRESEERYRKFFEEDLTGDFIASNDGCILACNPAFATIFGFESVESALYCNLNTIYSNEQAFGAIIELLLDRKKIEYHEAVGKRRDGKIVHIIENLIGLFDTNGGLVGVKGYVFDNTAHKLLEQQVQEAAKIEGLGRLAGGIAHDFNNLLGIILGYAERLAKNAETSPSGQRDVKAIHTAAQRGTNLVKQLLTFARKTDVAFEEMNVNGVVDELWKLLTETFPRNITMHIDVEPTLPVIIGDTNQIHQAVLNLCVNARDAMPAGGTLTLKTETVTGFMLRESFPEAHADFYVSISVSDTGIGMDEETRRKIFEPFFTTKERGRGTGLGLAVVHGIVNAHRGIVEVISETGLGTTFRVYLPIPQMPTRRTPHEEHEQHDAEGGTETILLVEDEDLMRELVESFLASKGYTILIARDGQEAVEMYKEHRGSIDLVLTDLGLPRLGGWEACQQMKKLDPQLKVIVASGYLDPNAKQEMILGGVQHFVHKPYLATEMSATIRELLDAKVAVTS